MTTMTPSINKVFKLIFHNLTPRYPPCPLKNYKLSVLKRIYSGTAKSTHIKHLNQSSWENAKFGTVGQTFLSRPPTLTILPLHTTDVSNNPRYLFDTSLYRLSESLCLIT